MLILLQMTDLVQCAHAYLSKYGTLTYDHCQVKGKSKRLFGNIDMHPSRVEVGNLFDMQCQENAPFY